MIFETNCDKGRAGLAMAIAYFGSNGYTVSLPLNDTQDYDLIVDKNNVLQKVAVRATGCVSKYGKYQLSLRCFGGTNGGLYGNVLESSSDLLFCLRADGLKYLIPIEDIPQRSSLTLTNCPSKYPNPKHFDTFPYIVDF